MNDLNDSAQISPSRLNTTSLHARLPRAEREGSAVPASVTLPVAFKIPKRYAATGGVDVFQSHRTRLFAVARSMLRSRAEAEDILQEAYLRWHQFATEDVQSPAGFLVTITTRLCLDRLRELKLEREHYVGPWLSEPIVEDEFPAQFPSPEMQMEFTEDVSVAILAVLERLGSDERAAFLLHEVFDYDYPEVAHILGKTEPTCRQMIHRARARVRDPGRRHVVTAQSRERVLAKFLAAAVTGGRKAVMALLAEDVEYVADGRGKAVVAHRLPLEPERLG